MIKRDYILDVIEQFGRAMANIVGLTNMANYSQAHEQLQHTAEQFLGLSLEQLEQNTAQELLAAVHTGRVETDVSNWVLLVELLRGRGDLYRSTFQEQKAVPLYLKGLDAATLVAQKTEIIPYFQVPIRHLCQRLEDYVLPIEIAIQLFSCYEIGGEFAAGENLLFDLLETSDNDPALMEMGLAFYDRLWKLSDYRLQHGGLSREEVEESMGELLEMIGN